MVSVMLACHIPIFLLLTLQLVQALPQPRNQFRRAGGTYDSESLQQRSFEAGGLVRRAPAASPCSKLDLDDAQSLPGWPKLEQYARTTWGEGDWTIAINPPGYKDKPATMCVAEAVQVVMTGAPKCSEIRKDIPPEKKNSNQIKVDEGYTNTGNWNITHVTTAAHAEFFSANFELPNIAPLHFDSLETIGQFINAPRNSFATVASNVTIRTTELIPVPDRTCIGTILEQECNTPARGKIQLVASGYIWFNYKTKRAPLANPTGAKHAKYTVKIEDVLKNATDRSAWIEFNGFMDTTWRYDYFDECRWNFELE